MITEICNADNALNTMIALQLQAKLLMYINALPNVFYLLKCLIVPSRQQLTV